MSAGGERFLRRAGYPPRRRRTAPHTREVFLALVDLGHDGYLWSSAGAATRLMGVSDLVFGCYSKFASPPVTVDYAVDDQPNLTGRRGGYAIAPFDSYPDDRELWKVVEQLRCCS